jgi:hypothetical protein
MVAIAPQVKVAEPTPRDWLLYRAVAIDGLGTHAAAAQYQTTTVGAWQARRTVEAWLAASERRPFTPEQERRLAEDLAVERLEYLYGQAMEAWRQSDENRFSTRTLASGDTITTERRSKVTFLSAAARIAIAIGQFRLRCQVIASRMKQPQQADTEPNPPVRDCSPSAAIPAAAAVSASDSIVATDCHSETSDDDASRGDEPAASAEDEFGPVQPDGQGGGGELPMDFLESHAQPPKPDLLSRRPLNRKERRKRRRLLERMKRKAK